MELKDELEVFVHFVQKLIEFPAVKVVCGVFVGLIHLMFGTVFRPAYGTVFLFVSADTVLGYWYAWSNPSITPQSNGIRRVAVKFIIYYGLMAIGHRLALSGFDTLIMIQMVFESIIILTELKSILENVKKLKDLKRWNVPLVDQLLAWVEGKTDQVLGQEKYRKNERSGFHDGDG